MEYACEMTVRLYDTDAAGFLFYGSQFRLAHAALEEFLAHLGQPIGAVLRERHTLYPVVHAEADYRAPLTAGDHLTVRVGVRAIGERSFTLGYRFLLPDGREAGSALTVHAALDTGSGAARALPGPLRAALAPYLTMTGDGP